MLNSATCTALTGIIAYRIHHQHLFPVPLLSPRLRISFKSHFAGNGIGNFEKLSPTNISTVTENTSGDRYPGNRNGNIQINNLENNLSGNGNGNFQINIPKNVSIGNHLIMTTNTGYIIEIRQTNRSEGKRYKGFIPITNHSNDHYSLSSVHNEWFTNRSKSIHIFTPITRVVATKSSCLKSTLSLPPPMRSSVAVTLLWPTQPAGVVTSGASHV